MPEPFAGQRTFTFVAGLIFAAIVVVHLLRIALEGTAPLHDPFFIGATLVALFAAIWSLVLLRRRS